MNIIHITHTHYPTKTAIARIKKQIDSTTNNNNVHSIEEREKKKKKHLNNTSY